MTVVHATVKVPGQTLAAVADWNANHVGATIGSMFFVGAGNVIQEDNANLFWDNTNKRLGIWTTTPQAPIHILKDGGGGTPAISAITALIVQDTVAWGVAISIIGKDNSYIYFGDAADENVGQIKYRHNVNWMEFHVAADAFAAFRIEPSVVTVNPSQQNDIDFRVRTDTVSAAFFVKASTNRVGVMTATPNAPFDVADVSRFGDSTTNYATFANDGELNLVGTARVLKQEWIQAEAIRAPGANPATFADVGISGAWQFADNLTRVVICKLPLPTDIDTSVDAHVFIGWSSPTISANCRWQVEYLVRAEDEDVSAAAEATLTQTEGSSANANGLVVSPFTIPAASLATTDRCLLLRITRLGADGADTLGDVANLTGICLHYTSNKLGTAT